MNDLMKTESYAVEKVRTLRNTIAPGLTDPEFELFVETCRSTGLNPITKEVWAIKTAGRLQIMAGLNGFLKIANSHPQFDGMEVDIKTDDKGSPQSATAKVYRKDRKYPSSCTVLLNEFRQGTPIWAKMPSVMLAKVAKSHAIREAFSLELAGLYTPEEMPAEYGPPKAVEAEIVEETPLKRLPEVETDEPKQAEAPAVKQAKKEVKLQKTIYNLAKVEMDKQEAAAKYLRERGAVEIREGVYESRMRLEKLTQAIEEENEV